MSTVPSPRRSPPRLLLRAGLAIGCALLLSGCVVYPVGYYRPHPVYYYGPAYYR
jgi:hypothetical protein